jgi:SAM-dependent methyltransferase
MWQDVIDLRGFYETRTGHVARHMIRHAVRQAWPDVRGQAIVGLGFATPYLRQFRGEAERVLAFMPAPQGVMAWPPEGPGLASLVDETELPLQDYSVDRVLVVHGIENSDYLKDMLGEIWRVLTGQGRLLVVVPNRRGIWARLERTPFGHGHPYSPSQLGRVLRDNRFVPERTTHALFVPPARSATLLGSAAAWERIGQRWFPHISGVNLIEASKQLYAPSAPVRAAERRRRGVLVGFPQAAPSPARRG